jgi:galactokinase
MALSIENTIRDKYIERFGTENGNPRIFRSPGRINLIGEHTDYNNGFVMPASVDKAIYFAIAPVNTNTITIYAADLNETYTFSVNDLSKPARSWPHYHIGIIEQIQKKGLIIGGFQAVFQGDIPIGAGLSSSAALECCLLYGLNAIYKLDLDLLTIVQMAQLSENEYVGVKCGIMDQFASVFGKQNEVIRLDCRSLAYEYFPLALKEYSIILCDSKVKHSLANSEYNTRREECEKGIQILQKYYPHIASLRDVTAEQIDAHRPELGETVYARCKFIQEEIARVQIASRLLTEGNIHAFGEKMYETHHGLQHMYAVSCPELDFLVDHTKSDSNVVGARMMGGGFGGCTINLVRSTHLDAFENDIKQAYALKFGIEMAFYRVNITNGTEEIRY